MNAVRNCNVNRNTQNRK